MMVHPGLLIASQIREFVKIVIIGDGNENFP